MDINKTIKVLEALASGCSPTTGEMAENESVLNRDVIRALQIAVIPLHRYVKEILAKYNGVPPQIISNQKMNDYLKELGQLAKIKEGTLISLTKGGVRQAIVHEKWKFINNENYRTSN